MKQVLWAIEVKATRNGDWRPVAGEATRSDAREVQEEKRWFYKFTRVVKYVREAA